MNSLRAIFAGDLALGGEFLQRARPAGSDLTFPFRPLADLLRGVDLMVVNLEGPIGCDGTPRAGRSALLHNESAVLDWLARFPIAVCILANNHMMDYGAEALARTRQVLSERGIHFVGAGSNEEEAEKALKISLGDWTLGFLTCTTDEPCVGAVIAREDAPGCAGLPDDVGLCARVRRLATEVDFVVIALHRGREYFHFPAPDEVALSRKLVAAGAHLVIGHHPHLVQGCEQLGEAVICHSLGNFLLPEMRAANGRPQYRKPASRQFALLEADLQPRRVRGWSIVGGSWDRHFCLRPYAGPAVARFAREIGRLSAPPKRKDYAHFYTSYARRRTRQLEREAVRDALMKLCRSDFATLRRTLSRHDLRRNLRRLGRLCHAIIRPGLTS